MPYNKSELHRIESIKQETPTVKSFSFKSQIAREAKPGQFLMLTVLGVDEIPMSVASTDGLDVEIQVSKVGDATKTLHEKNEGDYVGLRGPYGNGFSSYGDRHILVAGGYEIGRAHV